MPLLSIVRLRLSWLHSPIPVTTTPYSDAPDFLRLTKRDGPRVLLYNAFHRMPCRLGCVDTRTDPGPFDCWHHSPLLFTRFSSDGVESASAHYLTANKAPDTTSDVTFPLFRGGTFSLPVALQNVLKGDPSYLFRTHTAPPRHKWTS